MVGALVYDTRSWRRRLSNVDFDGYAGTDEENREYFADCDDG